MELSDMVRARQEEQARETRKLDERKAWLSGLKTGDAVRVMEFGREVWRGVVHSVTKTGRINVAHAHRPEERAATFNPDGHERDAVYHFRQLEPVTP